jgi:hypothetical protein
MLVSNQLQRIGNKMKSIKIITVNADGLSHEFVQECDSPELALAIISGTIKGCESSGWFIKSMETA